MRWIQQQLNRKSFLQCRACINAPLLFTLFSTSPRALSLSASDKSFLISPLFVRLNWSNCLHSARWLIVFSACVSGLRWSSKRGERQGILVKKSLKNMEQQGNGESWSSKWSSGTPLWVWLQHCMVKCLSMEQSDGRPCFFSNYV